MAFRPAGAGEKEPWTLPLSGSRTLEARGYTRHVEWQALLASVRAAYKEVMSHDVPDTSRISQKVGCLPIPFRFGSNAMARCAGAGAVKLQLADDIEAIKCSGRDIPKELEGLQRSFEEKTDWKRRLNALKHLQGLVLGCSSDVLLPLLQRCREALLNQVQDLRSALVRMCDTATHGFHFPSRPRVFSRSSPTSASEEYFRHNLDHCRKLLPMFHGHGARMPHSTSAAGSSGSTASKRHPTM
eukprot:symbB.v1.2.035170.t1/scaffold4675.1/size36618/1